MASSTAGSRSGALDGRRVKQLESPRIGVEPSCHTERDGQHWIGVAEIDIGEDGDARPSRRRRMNPTEPILERLRRLVLERQQLRERGASRKELETNRSAIVEAQWRLSKAAIEAYASHDEAKAA